MASTLDLFDSTHLPPAPSREALGEQAMVLRGWALPTVDALLAAIAHIEHAAPFRQMQTPGGRTISVAVTNCGDYGWISDRQGYRYGARDPLSDGPWPAMPDVLRELACSAASAAGFEDFAPDACLINRYLPGTRLTLHQDRNERDFRAPIVSVSLGLPATFLFGGAERSDPTRKMLLQHGDVAVWGGVDRLRYHGVMPLRDGEHPLLGARRINLTFRKAR